MENKKLRQIYEELQTIKRERLTITELKKIPTGKENCTEDKVNNTCSETTEHLEMKWYINVNNGQATKQWSFCFKQCDV